VKLTKDQLIDLRWALYHFTANHPRFFEDEQVLRVRKLITLVDKEIAKEENF